MPQNRRHETVPPVESRAAISNQLRDRSLRVTAQRLAVLAWLSDHPHATADEVRNGVTQQLGSVSMQAIYGVLTTCDGGGAGAAD